MTEHKHVGLRRIRRALLSVSDKTGLVDFARGLRSLDVELISTGGTAQTLRDAGLEVRDVSDVTGFPEMLDGRVKTLHPRIHGGLLAVRDNDEHMRALAAHNIEPLDMVVVNLYPFEQTAARAGATEAAVIEQIDIGGPSMIRSAAKNFRDVTVVVSPDDYANLVSEMQHNEGATSFSMRQRLAHRAFQRTASYDAAIASYFSTLAAREEDAHQIVRVDAPDGEIGGARGAEDSVGKLPSFDEIDYLPDAAGWTLRKAADLRYGENPHQIAALYHAGARGGGGVAHAALLSGKEMSFNNYVDADAAWQLVCDFDETACAIIKHTNPAGVGADTSPVEAYRRALATDPVSAFGGIVAFNSTVNEAAARALTEIFTEVVIAPDYTDAALQTLRARKNLRVLRTGTTARETSLDYKRITGGMLVQTADTQRLTREQLHVATQRAPTQAETDALLFAWTVCKHTKSNAIVYARAGQTVGVGAGQMSRVDSVRIGAMRAQLPVAGAVLASDAFFPFRDGIDEAAQHGITAIIQPGGSIRDEEIIAAANEHGLAMVLTGVRHFKH